MASVAQLHARLLSLPRDEQQTLITELSSSTRAGLATYIQAQQRQIDAGDEPELEPRPMFGSSAGRDSASEATPSSPASSAEGRSTGAGAHMRAKELLARARRMRAEINALRESETLTSDVLQSIRGRGTATAARLWADTCSDSLGSLPSSGSDLEDLDSEDSVPTCRSSSAALRALLRYLSDASPETRKGAIRSLTRERRVDLFAFMLCPEGRGICAGRFSEDELLETHFDDVHSSQSSDDEESDKEEIPSPTYRCGSHRFTPAQRNILLEAEIDSWADGSLPGSPASLPPVSAPPATPLTPSKQQLVFRARNAMPLGALQVKELSLTAATGAKAARKPPEAPQPPKKLEASGIDGAALRDWLCGHLSGPLCLARLLEGMQWARFSGQKDAKQLSSTEDLYSTSVASGYGGALGGMVGGVARAFAADIDSHLGGLFSSLDGPERGLREADAWLRASVGEEDGPKKRSGPKEHLEGLAEEDINLSFRRRCVALHPHRSGGDLMEYLKVHIYFEILRQWQAVAENPSLAEKPASRTGPGLSDHELTAELLKEHAKVIEDSKALAALDGGELKSSDDKLSSHVLQLSWMKEKLEAEASFMRSRGAYTTLGVGPEASDAELARAYKVQALRLHPDRGGSTEAFQALQSAYERVMKQRGGEVKKKTGEEDKDKDVATGEKSTKEARGAEAPAQSQKETSAPAENHDTSCGSNKAPESAAQSQEATPSASQEAPESAAQSQEETSSPVEKHDTSSESEVVPEEKHAADPASADQEDGVTQADSNAASLAAGDEAESKGKNSKHVEGADESESDIDPNDETESKGENSKHVEGVDESDSDIDPEDLEKSLTNAAAAIPAEVAAIQADMALQGAHMCSRAVRLCSRAATVGPDAWPQLERLASHVLDAAQHVGEACGRISLYAGSVPGTVMPLLDAVSQRSACLRESMVRQVVKGTSSLLLFTEKISSMSKEVSLRQSALMKHSVAVLDMLQGLLGHDIVSSTVCESIADVLETISRLAREAAESGAAAAQCIGEAQRHAENLVEVMGAAGLWESIHNKSEEKEEGKGSKDDKGSRDDDSSEDEKEPWQQHADWVLMLKKLNGEVVTLQQEIRGMVTTDPALISAVTPGQKEALFAVIAEVLAQARNAVSRAWYTQWITDDSGAGATAFPDLVEVALAFVVSASSWERIALPSIDARLLRLASLLDCRLLCSMLQENLFQHALQLASKEEVPLLEQRFAAATQAIKVGFLGG